MESENVGLSLALERWSSLTYLSNPPPPPCILSPLFSPLGISTGQMLALISLCFTFLKFPLRFLGLFLYVLLWFSNCKFSLQLWPLCYSVHLLRISFQQSYFSFQKFLSIFLHKKTLFLFYSSSWPLLPTDIFVCHFVSYYFLLPP